MTLDNRKCKICGKEFKPKVHNAVYCSKKHIKTCKYCGEEFECNNDVYYERRCCYKSECKKKSKKESVKNSAKKTYKTKKCEICGKEFKPNNSNQKYCSKTHKKECIICGKMFEVESSRYNRVKCCSKKCNALLGNQTYFEKHGKYKNFKNKELRENAQQSMLKKYGTTNVSNIPGTKEKTEQTNLKKYGVKNVLEKDSEFRKKIEDDNLKNFGSISPMGNPEIKEKIRQTNQEKYGVEFPLQNIEIWNKTKDSTIKNNNGLGYASDSIRKKARQTEKERYGTEYHARKNIKNFEIWDNLENFILENKNLYSSTELSNITGICYENIRRRINNANLGIYVKDFYTTSQYEGAFEQILKDNNIKYLKNYRKLIKPKEVDFYIKDLNIAIEISPTETHCSNQNKIMGNKPNDYHYKKFINCEKNNIRLFTIFDRINTLEVIELIKSNNTEFKDDFIKTDNALGYTKEFMKKQGYVLFKDIPPTKRYKILKTKEINYSNGDLEIFDCGHRIWKKDN